MSAIGAVRHHIVEKGRIYTLLVWLGVASIILSLSMVGRRLQHWALNTFTEYGVAGIIGVLLIGMSGAALFQLWREQTPAGLKPAVMLSVFLVLALAAVFLYSPTTEERLHFVTFGAFGYLSAKLFGLSGQVLSVLVLSGGDEVLQHYIPERAGQWRDVAMNVAGGAIGVVVARVIGSARDSSDKGSACKSDHVG